MIRLSSRRYLAKILTLIKTSTPNQDVTCKKLMRDLVLLCLQYFPGLVSYSLQPARPQHFNLWSSPSWLLVISKMEIKQVLQVLSKLWSLLQTSSTNTWQFIRTEWQDFNDLFCNWTTENILCTLIRMSKDYFSERCLQISSLDPPPPTNSSWSSPGFLSV